MIALAGAISAFLFPQKVPLIWYPLNEPGDEILYLDIKCASDQISQVKLYFNTTQGINESDIISFPISPTIQTYTYTFPLFDAPITEIYLDSLSDGGTLTVDHLRIIDRRGAEIRRFTSDMLKPRFGVASISPTLSGWKIKSQSESKGARVKLELFAPIVAYGIDQRSILRCLYSTSYLALMLWLLLLSVFFASRRPREFKESIIQISFMALLAVMFSVAGNRGLIKNSWHYAQFTYPELPDEIRLELDLISSSSTGSQLFWDSGTGYSERESDKINLAAHEGIQTARFGLPRTAIQALRFDPRYNGGSIEIQGIRIVDWGNRTHAILPLDSLRPGQQIEALQVTDKRLNITTNSDTDDPTTEFTPAAVAQINAAVAARLTRFDY